MDIIIREEKKLNPVGAHKSGGLNRQPYTLYLINRAINTKTIDKDAIDNFQTQILDILKDLIMGYTKGESTSVKVDTAEDILNSIIYCMDAGLKSLDNNEAAINVMKNGTAREVYDKGLNLVSACFEEAKVLYFKLRKKRLKVGLEAYDLTIDEGLMMFFEKYSKVFGSHHTMASIDYPLLADDMSLKGAFYILNYIETLYMENEFCRMFSEEEIKNNLTAFGRIYKINYSKTLTNIFELVLNSVFFSVLAEEEIITLTTSQAKYEVLVNKLEGTSLLDLDILIAEGLKLVVKKLNIKESKLSEYIYNYEKILKTRLASALATGSLNNLVLVEENVLLKGEKTIFIAGERMSDECFIELVDTLTSEFDTAIKVNMIKSEVHSFEDFIDILEGNCIFGDEYVNLFSQLSDHELALLAGIIFSDDMRDQAIDIRKAIAFGISTRAEWQDMLVEFLSGLKSEKLKAIEACMEETINM